MPNTLLLDTSCSYASVLCTMQDIDFFESKHRPEKGHDHFVFSVLDNIAHQSPDFRSQLEVLGCCIGPGRFNGVRVACSIISTFMSVLGKPAYVCTAFELMRAADIHKHIAGYAIFAKKGFAYYQEADFSRPPQMVSILDLHFNTHVLEIEGSFIQSSAVLDLNLMSDLIQKGQALKIVRAIDLDPAYCALI